MKKKIIGFHRVTVPRRFSYFKVHPLPQDLARILQENLIVTRLSLVFGRKGLGACEPAVLDTVQDAVWADFRKIPCAHRSGGARPQTEGLPAGDS